MFVASPSSLLRYATAQMEEGMLKVDSQIQAERQDERPPSLDAI